MIPELSYQNLRSRIYLGNYRTLNNNYHAEIPKLMQYGASDRARLTHFVSQRLRDSLLQARGGHYGNITLPPGQSPKTKEKKTDREETERATASTLAIHA